MRRTPSGGMLVHSSILVDILQSRVAQTKFMLNSHQVKLNKGVSRLPYAEHASVRVVDESYSIAEDRDGMLSSVGSGAS